MNSITHEGANSNNGSGAKDIGSALAQVQLHASWRALIRYCQDLQHGEIERLKIQNGLPVIAEVTTKKVKFTP